MTERARRSPTISAGNWGGKNLHELLVAWTRCNTLFSGFWYSLGFECYLKATLKNVLQLWDKTTLDSYFYISHMSMRQKTFDSLHDITHNQFYTCISVCFNSLLVLSLFLLFSVHMWEYKVQLSSQVFTFKLDLFHLSKYSTANPHYIK